MSFPKSRLMGSRKHSKPSAHGVSPCLSWPMSIFSSSNNFLKLFYKISPRVTFFPVKPWPKVHVRGTCSASLSIAQTQLSPNMSILEDTEVMEPWTIDNHSHRESFRRATALSTAPLCYAVCPSAQT